MQTAAHPIAIGNGVAAHPESILLTGPPFGRRCFRTRKAWQHQDTENEKESQQFPHRTFSLELLFVESSQNYRFDTLTRQSFVLGRREDVVDNLVSRPRTQVAAGAGANSGPRLQLGQACIIVHAL
jgi:hypothetical protein